MDRTLNILGIAKKAGLIAIGGDDVNIATRNQKARLVVTAADVSERTARRARTNADYGGAAYISVPYTRFEIGGITGRGSPGVVAVLDRGLAASFVKGLAGTYPERYGDIAERLTVKFDRRRTAV